MQNSKKKILLHTNSNHECTVEESTVEESTVEESITATLGEGAAIAAKGFTV
jgi:hypothetical protein